MNLPVPPPAYWNNVPWWAYLSVLLIITVLASPFALQVLRGRTGSYQTREQAFSEDKRLLEIKREAFLVSLQTAEAAAQASLEREREGRQRDRAQCDADRELLEADRDEGWDRGRGMEDVAHTMRHSLVALTSRFNALRDLARKLVRGEVVSERMQATLDQMEPAAEPEPVPMLRHVAKKSA